MFDESGTLVIALKTLTHFNPHNKHLRSVVLLFLFINEKNKQRTLSDLCKVTQQVVVEPDSSLEFGFFYDSEN